MPIDSQVEVKQVRLVKGTGSQIDAARQAGEILETDLVAQTDAPDLVPETRTINGKPLSSNINLDASDVGAVASNTAITGATKCKITYDSKGLVTAGTNLNSSDITTALGYMPYNSTNPSGYQANVIETVKVNGTALTPSSKAVDITVPTNNNQLTNGAGYITSSALNGYATQTWVGQQGYLTGITSSDVTTALGYTPYNSSNPNGYTSNVGTVTSVNNVQPVNGNVSLTIPTVNNATLTIQKNGSNVATFTANSSTNQTANITVPTDNTDLTNGAGYITGITGSDVTTALGYTPLQSSDILNVVDSTATNKALSANMGKELQDQIDNLKARGRYLALWNCATGLAQSNPTQSPYNYQTGDYFIIGTIATGSGTNYRPNGSSYTTGVASTTVETEPVAVNDVYYYDGTNWSLQINTQKEVTFSSIGGSPYDNSNLSSALNGKQAELVSGTNIKTINNTSILGSGNLSIDSLPSQSGQNGKYLKTNGTSASWSTLDLTGYATEQWVGQQGYITGITSSDVTSALGYTPYNSSNPNGYTSNVGTVTSVNNVQPVNGNVTISIPSQVTESTVSGWGFTKNTGTVTSVNNVSPTNGNVTLSIPSDISSNKVNGAPLSTSSSYFFGVSDSAATDVEKVVSIPSITSLNTGQFIIVLPTVTSTVESSTLKLNNFTAYPMRYQNSAITTTTDAYVWTANTPSVFVFDGEYWRFVCQGYRQVYSAMSVSEGTTGTATTSRVMSADRLKQIIQETTLTGIDTSTSGAVVATDTITEGIGKLQAQIGSIEIALHTINSGS